MTLTLEVTGPKGTALGAGRRMVFDSAGGTIGRNPGTATHWVLSDPHVSSTHAVIRYQQGVFTIEDRSRNGTFLNSLENRLPHGEGHPLANGDTIFIDPFDIRVSITTASAPKYQSGDPFDEPPAPGSGAGAPSRAWQRPDDPILPPLDPALDSGGTPSGDSVMRGLGLPGKPAPPPKAPSSKDLWGQQAWNDSFSPPEPVPVPPTSPRPGATPEIPTNWQDDAPSIRPGPPRRPEPPAPPTPVDPAGSWPLPAGQDAKRGRDESRPVERPSLPGRRPAHPRTPADEPGATGRSSRIDVDDIFRGAGLDPADLTPEVARALGQILRIVVQGTMDVLHARRGIKEEFRIESTMFEPVGRNNPLKFSAGVDDALHNLFVRRSPGYLGPAAAFEDAFEDLRHHQMAMLDGMRVAFEAMLEEFNPTRLEEAFDRQQKKAARLPVPMKPRYWELYGERFRDMVKDAETAFRELFGDEFRAAYREQLARLKAQSRSEKA